MLPPHIFDKKERGSENLDKVKEMFPGIGNDDADTEIIESHENLIKVHADLEEKYNELETEFDKKIGSKKELVEEIKALRNENSAQKADLDELLNSSDEPVTKNQEEKPNASS